jgi:hypothetical protein
MGNCTQPSSLNSELIARPVADVSLSCLAYGVRVAFETSFALSEYLPTPLIPGGRADAEGPASVIFSLGQTRSSEGAPLFTVSEDGVPVLSSGDIEVAAHALESAAHQFVAAAAQDVVFVHAGVVSWRGKAILVPGRSYSGKSTLVMALVEAGATYYSDEYALLDSDGRVHPFPRLPRLRPDVRKTAFRANPLANGSLCPLPVGLVLNTRYSPAGSWKPRLLTPGETLLALLQNTVAVRRQAELSIKALKNTVASAIGWESERADAAGAADEILNLIDQSWHVSTSVTSPLIKEETI